SCLYLRRAFYTCDCECVCLFVFFFLLITIKATLHSCWCSLRCAVLCLPLDALAICLLPGGAQWRTNRSFLSSTSRLERESCCNSFVWCLDKKCAIRD